MSVIWMEVVEVRTSNQLVFPVLLLCEMKRLVLIFLIHIENKNEIMCCSIKFAQNFFKCLMFTVRVL